MLVDAGSKNQQLPFIRHLEKPRISAETIGFIVVTHVHFDHVASLKAINVGMSGGSPRKREPITNA
jgi:glyoxylase-like metal-dependent hydrolase (beta-lactamase superfamily II)